MSFHYLAAAKLLEQVKDGQSLKKIVSKSSHVNKTQYALVMETLKYEEVLEEIARRAGCPLSEEEEERQPYLKLVMLYDLLFGKGKIEGGGSVKRSILEGQKSLFQARDEMMTNRKHFTELLDSAVVEASSLPLYVRINEVKVSMREGMEYLQARCASLLRGSDGSDNNDQETLEAVHLDEDIPALAVLPSTARAICQDSWVKEGKLIVQDKASCFPGQLVFDEWLTLSNSNSSSGGGDCIDACAAPGNKTSHLAALLYKHQQEAVGNTSLAATVYAFDKSKERAQTLQRRLLEAGLTKERVKVTHRDFLTVDVQEDKYNEVRCVLLDPSCSGSGIVRDLGRLVENSRKEDENNEESTARLLKLQSFQLLTLQKAASFPAVEAIVYSTCSIHEEENEQVVASFLRSEVGNDWELKGPQRLKNWKRRGISHDGQATGLTLSTEEARKVVRCSVEDGTNGFFVAVFRRKAGRPRLVPPKMQSEGVVSNTEASLKRTLSREKNEGDKNGHEEEEETPKKKTKGGKKASAETTQSSFFAPKGFHIGKQSKKRFHKRK
eukprot:gene6959-7700_t